MAQGDSSLQVVDCRQTRRFKTRRLVDATFGACQGTVLDLGEGGFQIEHAGSIKISTSGSIHIKNPDTNEVLSIGSTVVWSRLSSSADGRMLYHTGLRIEEPIEPAAAVFGRLVRACGTPDTDSLERKRQAMIARQQERERAAAGTPNLKTVPSSTPIE